MGKVCYLKPCQNVVESLRRLADKIESGELEISELTAVASGPGNMFVAQYGSIRDDDAARDAVFNLTFGLNWLTNRVFSLMGEEQAE